MWKEKEQYYIIGTAIDSGYYSTDNDGYLIKYDSNGNEQWKKSSSSFGGINSVAQTNDGGYIIGTAIDSVYSTDNGYLIKYDSNGNEQWKKSSSSFGGINSVVVAE